MDFRLGQEFSAPLIHFKSVDFSGIDNHGAWNLAEILNPGPILSDIVFGFCERVKR